MAVKGFNVGGAINRYDFNSLVNKEGAVTAEMLGSDVTTQLTTMSGNISTLQSQVATLNDGFANLGTFGTHTFSGTTTSSGALAIPGTYSAARIFDIRYADGTVGLVYRRDVGYFTCMLAGPSTGTYVYPNANSSVTVTFAYWIPAT